MQNFFGELNSRVKHLKNILNGWNWSTAPVVGSVCCCTCTLHHIHWSLVSTRFSRPTLPVAIRMCFRWSVPAPFMHHDNPFSNITGTCDPTGGKAAGSPAIASHVNPLDFSGLVGVGFTGKLLPSYDTSRCPKHQPFILTRCPLMGTQIRLQNPKLPTQRQARLTLTWLITHLGYIHIYILLAKQPVGRKHLQHLKSCRILWV